MTTDMQTFLSDLNGGVFQEQLSRIFSDVGGAVVDHGKPGKITLEFDLKQIATSAQVTVDHVIKYKKPTSRGHLSEVHKTSTPMFVGRQGKLSFYPENQGVMFNKTGEVMPPDGRFPNVDASTGEVKPSSGT